MVRNPSCVSLHSHGNLFDLAIWNPEGQPLYVLLELSKSLSYIKVLKDFSPESPLYWLLCSLLWLTHWSNSTYICIHQNFGLVLGNIKIQKHV